MVNFLIFSNFLINLAPGLEKKAELLKIKLLFTFYNKKMSFFSLIFKKIVSLKKILIFSKKKNEEKCNLTSTELTTLHPFVTVRVQYKKNFLDHCTKSNSIINF